MPKYYIYIIILIVYNIIIKAKKQTKGGFFKMLHNTKKLNALKKKIKDFGPAPYDNKNTALIRLANSWEMSSNNGYEVLIVEGLNKLDDNTIVFFLEAAEISTHTPLAGRD